MYLGKIHVHNVGGELEVIGCSMPGKGLIGVVVMYFGGLVVGWRGQVGWVRMVALVVILDRWLSEYLKAEDGSDRLLYKREMFVSFRGVEMGRNLGLLPLILLNVGWMG